MRTIKKKDQEGFEIFRMQVAEGIAFEIFDPKLNENENYS